MKMMPQLTTVLLCITFLLLTIACDQSDSESASETIPDPELGLEETSRPFMLYGTSWKLESVKDMEPKPGREDRGMPYIKFDYDGEKVTGYAGCNTFHSGYKLGDDNSLSFSQIATTKMMCEHMETEEALLSVLNQVNAFTLWDGKLLLQKDDETLAVFIPHQDEI